jgi:carboxymethylenebutenolidase
MSSAAKDLSADRLANSPRHQEWVEVNNGDKEIYTWVVYPQTSEKVPVVILIHENKGLSDWVRGMADQVAEAGYIAVAPDLLSDFNDTMKRSSDFPSDDERTKAIGQLKPENVQSDLNAVAQWAETIPASNGKLASAGFCWGGGQSFAFATTNRGLDVALVFYGSSPSDANAYKNISSPVYGFYGSNDERINATIPTARDNMSATGKQFEYVTYDGAGHAFMRLGEDPSGEPANVAARNAAWTRMKDILSKL